MYYFIGIKGSGMSALAVILKQLGYNVSGSDIEKHFFTEAGLIENDIPFYGFSESNIKEGMTIIKGASIKEENVELLIEKNVFKDEYFACHPCVNTATVKFSTVDLKEKVLPALNRTYTVVDLECPEDEV